MNRRSLLRLGASLPLLAAFSQLPNLTGPGPSAELAPEDSSPLARSSDTGSVTTWSSDGLTPVYFTYSAGDGTVTTLDLTV